MSQNTPIRVGIIGLGRSGWGIHAKAIRNQPDRYTVVAAHDPILERTQQAVDEFGCTGYDSVQGLLGDDNVELVIVASPNPYHAEMVLQALEAGKHVVCEKPFGLTVADADRMIAAAEKSGRLLQPFQQRRWEDDFRKVKEICDSGLLGEIQFVRICWHGFRRRWDWQTTKEMSGGALNNNGPHPIDHAMELFGGNDPVVQCEMRRVLCSGDAEDFLRVTLREVGRPTVEVELIDSIAYPQDRWFVAGSSGGLRGNGNHLEWKWVEWSSMPDRPVSLDPTPDRSYNSESLEWKSDTWEPTGPTDAGAGATPSPIPVLKVYANMYDVIRNGAAQEITPQGVRSRLVVFERARAAGKVV